MRQPLPLPDDVIAAARQATIAAVSAVMRVEVSGDVGYLFFLEGELVHAATLELEAEAAASTILAWQDARLAWCERRWPRSRTIFQPWSELSGAPAVAASAPESVPPASVAAAAPAAQHSIASTADDESDEPATSPEVHFPSSFGLRQVLARAEFKNALRLGNAGNVTETRGSTTHLRAILRSSLTLGDSLGAALGVGPLIAAEASAPAFHRLVMHSTEDASAAETSGGSALQIARAFLKL